jgi:hypothetical protein
MPAEKYRARPHVRSKRPGGIGSVLLVFMKILLPIRRKHITANYPYSGKSCASGQR